MLVFEKHFSFLAISKKMAKTTFQNGSIEPYWNAFYVVLCDCSFFIVQELLITTVLIGRKQATEWDSRFFYFIF